MITIRAVEAFTNLCAVQAVASWLASISAHVANPTRWTLAELRVFVAYSAVLTAAQRLAFVLVLSALAALFTTKIEN